VEKAQVWLKLVRSNCICNFVHFANPIGNSITRIWI